MASIPAERLGFFKQQRLLSSDLQNLDQFNREMRWLHNRSLHQPGVASGYAIRGSKGDREVVIQPGYAVDVCGREIVLTEDRTIAVPPVAGAIDGKPAVFDLAVAYPSDDELEDTETRQGLCDGQGVVRYREQPTFCWIDIRENETLIKEVLCGKRILLARAEVFNCQLYRAVSLEHRRNARPSEQPYIGCGSTDSKIWDEPVVDVLGIQLKARVNTSAAKFRTAARYFAHVVGPRQIQIEQEMVAVDGFTTISNPTAESFQIGVLIPALILLGGRVTPQDVAEAIEKELDWHVEWIGVEG